LKEIHYLLEKFKQEQDTYIARLAAAEHNVASELSQGQPVALGRST
jgi:hypothetical protein